MVRGMLAVLGATALTAVSWGCYGPTLHASTHELHSRLVPFICVGLAYFLVAVIVPLGTMAIRPEGGSWTARGIFWSLFAGTFGALGALGVLLALHLGGAASTIYVMPLVFGGAPVVNTVFSMLMGKGYSPPRPLFFVGLLSVILGAVFVLLYRPLAPSADAPLDAETLRWVVGFAISAALFWGCYGPMVHWGQAHMGMSRLRPLVCVGLAYFLIAVLIPLGLLQANLEPNWQASTTGFVWGLVAGTLGAVGALGVIMAFVAGGKPIYVMPLIFGGAPVINTLVTMSLVTPGLAPTFPFYIGLAMVVAGAVTVLIFAPKPGGTPAGKK